MKRIAFYGGSFDPVHKGHIAIGAALLRHFALDEFVFLPAFHAPHKKRLKPTPAIDRYAMLCLATSDQPAIRVSKLEIELPDRPYTVETLERLNGIHSEDKIFFVMGADSWLDIKTWRDWQRVLSMTNHIVVSRPGYELSSDHLVGELVTPIVDLRRGRTPDLTTGDNAIYFTDAVIMDLSATSIRQRVRGLDATWRSDISEPVANYIEKYQIYK